MMTIRLKARLNESGELDFVLPADLPTEDFELILDVSRDDELHNGDFMIDDEILVLLRSEPLTGAEIVARGLTGGWADQGIGDSVVWIEEQKHKRRERHKWQAD